jgi:uncharacterized protein (TIGR02145 family)
MKTTNLFLLSALAFFACASLRAQVTIGGLENPKSGAILDLNSTVRGGLALSNVVIHNIELIPQETNVFAGVADVDVNPDLRGAMVYNTGQDPAVPAGIYIWNGNCWTKNGGDFPLTAPLITVNGTATDSFTTVENSSVTFAVVSSQPDMNYAWYEADSPSSSAGAGNSYTIPALSVGTYHYYCKAGSKVCPSANGVTSATIVITVFLLPNPQIAGAGTFAGRTCFDVALTEGNGRGTLAVRQDELLTPTSAIADFFQAVTGTQTYTFTPPGTVSKLRFYVLEPATYTGQIVQSLSYDPDLETQLNLSGAKNLSIVYKSDLNSKAAGKNNAEALKVDIYAVYNDQGNGNGADRTVKLTASIKDCSCCGAYTDAAHTQWLSFMCYNLGATHNGVPFMPSQAIQGAMYKWGVKDPALTQAQDHANPSISDWMTNPVYTTPPGTSDEDWQMDDGHNPCPAGWRVPAEDEWISIIESVEDDWTPIPATSGDWGISPTNYNTGMKIGDALFLPAAGYRSGYNETNGSSQYRGNYGTYWSSTAKGVDRVNMHFFYNQISMNKYSQHHGFSVRCVAD